VCVFLAYYTCTGGPYITHGRFDQIIWVLRKHPESFPTFSVYLEGESTISKLRRLTLFKCHPDKNLTSTASEKEVLAANFLVAINNYDWLKDEVKPLLADEAELASKLGCEAQMAEILQAEYFKWMLAPLAPVPAAAPAPAPPPTAAPAPAHTSNVNCECFTTPLCRYAEQTLTQSNTSIRTVHSFFCSDECGLNGRTLFRLVKTDGHEECERCGEQTKICKSHCPANPNMTGKNQRFSETVQQ
jgi:hypothetical protein